MSVQPYEDDGEVYYTDPDPVPMVEDDDAIEVMWMERNSKPYVPIPSRPFRAVRCTSITKNGPRAGKRCGREATLGTTVCEAHGANLPLVKRAADQRKSEAILRLVNMSDELVDGLQDLAKNAVSEAVRLKAITEAMDRAGIRGGTDLNVTVETVDTATDQIRSKLETLRKRTIEGEILDSTTYPETIIPDEAEDLEVEEGDPGEYYLPESAADAASSGATIDRVDEHNPLEENP